MKKIFILSIFGFSLSASAAPCRVAVVNYDSSLSQSMLNFISAELVQKGYEIKDLSEDTDLVLKSLVATSHNQSNESALEYRWREFFHSEAFYTASLIKREEYDANPNCAFYYPSNKILNDHYDGLLGFPQARARKGLKKAIRSLPSCE